MMNNQPQQRILLGITGGIAAYKSALLLRLFKKAGADVRVIMTNSAQEFITPLTLQALSGHPVHRDLFDEEAEAAMGHIELAKWADKIIIAPASANTIAKLANGMADNLLTNVCLATDAPITIAPAMNQAMWHKVATQNNIATCKKLGFEIVGPGQGEQACGDTGYGRMLEPLEIFQACHSATGTSAVEQTLNNARVTITAGPTREYIDPVRFLSNPSSGKMGFALAQAAADLGAQVTLIAGPVSLDTPQHVTRVNVTDAQQMFDASKNASASCDIFIACAAVADYRPETSADHKIKKSGEDMAINFVRNPDILANISKSNPGLFCVGFAAETQNLAQNAQEKLTKKQLRMIIANDVSDKANGFASDQNSVNVFWQQQNQLQQKSFPSMEKVLLAKQLMQLISEQFSQK